ncbi:calcium-independent phospholipase A2-gamma-like [Ctenocephalides felis]|uniref:calcium-independent phospholipase A2-gamma-like n=1 Tax=Ctenocephalides felis TaxID=7515 RepID=UPI000E6E5193|nr:calcium-independent phospholipase A2-gamma-like [Ctenocephalides felis]
MSNKSGKFGLINAVKDLINKGQFGLGKDWNKIILKIQSALPYNDGSITITRGYKGELVNSKIRDTKSDHSKSFLEALGKNDKTDKLNCWKLNQDADKSKNIAYVTKHVVSSLSAMLEDDSILQRLKEFCDHMNLYPNERHHAIKLGALSTILRLRHNAECEEIIHQSNEALSLIGYCDPLPGRGVRILSIDGGGVRGVLVIEMLKKLEQLTGKRVFEMFDYIAGVSTGAILGFSLVSQPNRTLDETSQLYKELSSKMFSASSPLSVLSGTSRLVWSHAYYDTSKWEEFLKEYLGDISMIKTSRIPGCPKLSAISCIANASDTAAFVFRNYTLPWRIHSVYCGTHSAKVWEAVRASSAAPTYFEEFKLGDYLHQDGGIMFNNPTAVAIHEAKLLWPGSPIQCVISFGTGRTTPSSEQINSENLSTSSWKTKFIKILCSATDTEAVHTTLNDLLPSGTYFRFNPYLTEMLTMVETRPEKVAQLELDAAIYMRKNEDKFLRAAEALCQSKPVSQKLTDWVRLQAHVVGFL